MDGLPVTTVPVGPTPLPSLCTGSCPPGARNPNSDDGVDTFVPAVAAVAVADVDVVDRFSAAATQDGCCVETAN